MADIESRQRAKRIAQRRGLGGMANDAKWREFFVRVIDAAIPLEVKFLYEESAFVNGAVWTPSEHYVEGTGMGPRRFTMLNLLKGPPLQSTGWPTAARNLAH